MYYLQSRGIDYATAKVLLADGFISQVAPRIKSELLRDGFARRLEALLNRWGGH
jgi:Fe-S cluster assembly scaffold protein SufB